MKKKALSILLCSIMAFGCLAGCGDSAQKKETEKNTAETEAETAAKEETEAAKTKAGGPELTLMITNSTDPWAETVKEMVEKKFPDYSLTFKNWDEPTVEQTVKTAFAADQAMDVVMYWPTYMKESSSSLLSQH